MKDIPRGLGLRKEAAFPAIVAGAAAAAPIVARLAPRVAMTAAKYGSGVVNAAQKAYQWGLRPAVKAATSLARGVGNLARAGYGMFTKAGPSQAWNAAKGNFYAIPGQATRSVSVPLKQAGQALVRGSSQGVSGAPARFVGNTMKVGGKMIKRPIKTMWDATLYDIGADTANTLIGKKVVPTIFSGVEDQNQE